MSSVMNLFKKRITIFLIVFFFLILISSKAYFTIIKTYVSDKPLQVKSIHDVPLEYWQKLANKRIFFGHQSVGAEILDGIKKLQEQYKFINLRIVNLDEIDAGPYLAHCSIGKCTDTFLKINDFKNNMDKLGHSKIDIALMEFCHADIAWEYDTAKIFENYKYNFNQLKNRYPDTLIIHVTVPLCSNPKGLRILREIAKLLTFRPSIWDDNHKRLQYNAKITDEFGKTDPVFDLAKEQSIDPRGLQHYAVKKNEKILILAPVYTSGINGLNETGKQKIAEQFLIFLAENAQR